MKNVFGNNITLTLFGESHGQCIGAVLDGLASGIEVNEEFIKHQLTLRRPAGAISTARSEADPFSIVSGVVDGKTTGTPICIIIENENKKSRDYGKIDGIARPGHADYAAFCKYNGYEDRRGGGHFSGRITAAVVAACAIVIYALAKKGINIGTHIRECGGVADRSFENLNEDIKLLNNKVFAVLSDEQGEKMQEKILKAKDNLDSVGGILETAITGMPSGVGEPWFDTVEGLLSYALFSIPAVKGVEFGAGFAFADMFGSEANDCFKIKDGEIVTDTNNNGGINGGITNGMPVTFSCVVKPTPSISKKQQTVDFENNREVDIEIQGRHDPCIVHRARVVVDSITAFTLADLLVGRFGTDWLRG
ncbi:MAG: chorismate synthase [Acutalibacteraceae bacterium]|nr:chorismate synthase [Acutalibacteraceae bacterium]